MIISAEFFLSAFGLLDSVLGMVVESSHKREGNEGIFNLNGNIYFLFQTVLFMSLSASVNTL